MTMMLTWIVVIVIVNQHRHAGTHACSWHHRVGSRLCFLHLTVEAQKRNSIAEALHTPFVATAYQLCSTAASFIFFFSFFVTMLGFGACQHAHTHA
jgi:hypothetical protein